MVLFDILTGCVECELTSVGGTIFYNIGLETVAVFPAILVDMSSVGCIDSDVSVGKLVVCSRLVLLRSFGYLLCWV